MLEIKLFSSFLFSWRMSAVPISGAKVDIIPYSFISWRSFDFRQCSKVFSGVSICSKTMFLLKKLFRFAHDFCPSVRPCVFTITGLTSQHTQFCFYTSFLSPSVSDFFPSSLSFLETTSWNKRHPAGCRAAACRSTSRRVALATVRTQELK